MMAPPEQPPNRDNVSAWEAYALDYLREQLGDAAPDALHHAATPERSPLDGEGAVALFRFETQRGQSPEPCYVVVGQTEPNYYPAYDLSADDAFCLHVGTRFMLVMGVAQTAPPATDDYDAEKDARQIVDRIAPDKQIEHLEVAATFDVEGQLHNVLRARVDGQPVYIFGRDAPMGFSEATHLPAPVAYRIHLGRVLRLEPSPDGPVETEGP